MHATTVEEPTRPAVLISSDDGIGSYRAHGVPPPEAVDALGPP